MLVGKGWIANSVGGGGSSLRTREGKVSAWTSNSKGDSRGRVVLLQMKSLASCDFHAIKKHTNTYVAALILSKTSCKANSRALTVSASLIFEFRPV